MITFIKHTSVLMLVLGASFVSIGYPIGFLWISIGLLGLVTAKITAKITT